MFQIAMRRALAVSCMLVCWYKIKGNEAAVERKVDLLNAIRRRWYCHGRIWQYNGWQSEGCL